MTPAAANESPNSPWISRRTGDGGIAVGTVPAAMRFRRHAHEGPHLCGVIGGGFVEKAGRGYESAGPGTLRLSPSTSHHIDFSSAGARCVVIELDALPEGLALDRSRFFTDPWLATTLARLVPAVASTAPGAVAALDHGVAELLAQILRRARSRAAPVPPAWLRGVRDGLCDRRGEAVALDELARPLGIHRAHLARAFRDHYGVTIGAFVRRLRVERAVELLANRERAGAAQCGGGPASGRRRAVIGDSRPRPGHPRLTAT